MKKLLKVFALALLVAIAVPAAKAERVYTPVDKMPTQIQTFLNDYYANVPVAKSWIKMMRATTEPMWYVVQLKDGTKVKFNLEGNWYSINAKYADNGASINLLPNEARSYISTNFPTQKITSIKFKKDEYKVTLDNGQKIKFDKSYGVKVKKEKSK